MYNPKIPKDTIRDDLIVNVHTVLRICGPKVTYFLLDDEFIGHVVFHIISIYGRMITRVLVQSRVTVDIQPQLACPYTPATGVRLLAAYKYIA